MVERVSATPAALELIAVLRAQHGDLMFHQSGGCCDGSSPMCYPLGEFLVGDSDVQLGEIGGCPFYMSSAQFEYWQHTHIIIDVVPGRGSGFSLEAPEGVRFRLGSGFSVEERRAPPPIGSWVSYRHDGIHPQSGIPRFARFLRLRDDLAGRQPP